MPRVTKKISTIKYLKHKVSLRKEARMQRMYESDDDSILDIIDRKWERLLARVRKDRYLFRKKYRRELNLFDLKDALNLEDSLERKYNDDEFLMLFRMSRESFLALVEKVRSHKAFRCKNKKSRSVEFQLLVFLYRTGLEGSAGGNRRVSANFGIGSGTVGTYVTNCMNALLSIKREHVHWPNDEEKKTMKDRMSTHGFRHCIGIVDGTLIMLKQSPNHHPETYFSRKKQYAITALIVCDDNAKVTYIYGGWPGSVHDNRMFKNCRIYQKRGEYFADFEYLLGDSAFSASAVMVQSFKKVRQQVCLANDMEMFNTKLAQVRIKSEHCIGMLKGRFQCLKKMNTTITSKPEGVKFVMDMLMCCSIMHNILLDLNHDEDNDQSIIQCFREDLGKNMSWTNFDEEEYDPLNVYDDNADRRPLVYQSIIQNLRG